MNAHFNLSKLSLLIVIFLAFYGHRSHQNVFIIRNAHCSNGKIFNLKNHNEISLLPSLIITILKS